MEEIDVIRIELVVHPLAISFAINLRQTINQHYFRIRNELGLNYSFKGVRSTTLLKRDSVSNRGRVGN